MEALVIASKILSQLNGLDRTRKIDNKIIIDLKNRTIIVEGTDYTYSPTGVVISQEVFRYERDNIPAISAKEEVTNEQGDVIIPATEEIPANNRFNNYAASPIGLGIAGMVQQTINFMD